MSNLYVSIRTALLERAESIALQANDTDWTGTALDRWVGRYAAALASLGLAPGDRIAVQVEKSADNIALYLATLQLGAVYLPLNTAYQPQEIRYFLGDATPRIFVCAPDRIDALTAVAHEAGVECVMTLGASGDGTLPALVEQHTARTAIAVRDDADLCVICYTSGTTGRSKGAMITQGNLQSNARTLIELWGFTSNDVLLHALPLYHVHGLFVALHCALLSGARISLHPKFEPNAVFAELARATVMMGVPTFYTRLLSDQRLHREAVRNVRLFISGSAPLLAETFEQFEARTGQRILERYGMTETGMITSNPLHGERRGGTVGLPLQGVSVRITNESGEVVPHGMIGSVEVKGPNVFKGYWRMPEKTVAEFRSDGYFVTGDLGQFEPDGYLRLVGRAKDLIISGGLNVYPKEIEEAIDALPGVNESAVFAIPHPDFGEAVAAAVTLQPHSGLTADAISAALRTQLAAFKTPKRIYIVAELPRNAMSKVQKAVLRERYKSAFAS